MCSRFTKDLLLFTMTAAVTVATALSPILSSAQSNYEIDPEHSFVTMKVNRFALVNVVGFFPEVAGSVTYDASEPLSTTSEVIIQTESLYMGISEDRDLAIKSPVFLDVENYPEITFKMTSVINDGFRNEAVGELTIHGKTNVIHMPFEVKGPEKDPTGLTTIAISGSLVIDRRDYGITFDRVLASGLPFIGFDVEIEISVLAVRSE